MAVKAYWKGAIVSHFLSWSQIGKRYGELRRENGRSQRTMQTYSRGTMSQLHALAPSHLSPALLLQTERESNGTGSLDIFGI